MIITEDQFMEEYLYSFEVRGVDLEDVENLHGLYKNMILDCKSIPDMMGVCREFRFLAVDSFKSLNKLSNFYIPHIKSQFTGEEKTQPYEIDIIAPIIVPKIMLHATMIANKFDLPEYYAAIQYVRAVHFGKEKHA